MKKIAILFFVVVSGFAFFNFTSHPQISLNQTPDGETWAMPENVKTVIDNSCYGCHHSESKNVKGRLKLNFDHFGKEYSAVKSASKMKEILEVVEAGDMPPKKFLDNNPDKALTDDNKKLIADWAKAEGEKFMGK
jgi:hypothetical protein